MPTEFAYTALLDRPQFVQDTVNSLLINPTEKKAAIDQALLDMTNLLEDRIDRLFIVREYVEIIPYDLWTRIPGDANKLRWQAPAEDFPLVQILSPTTVTISPFSRKRRHFMIDTPESVEVKYFAGYRRGDFTLAMLQAAKDPDDNAATLPLALLTVLPLVVPAGLRGGCMELALGRINQAAAKTFGTGSARQQIGDNFTTIQSKDKNFVEDIIDRLVGYRKRI